MTSKEAAERIRSAQAGYGLVYGSPREPEKPQPEAVSDSAAAARRIAYIQSQYAAQYVTPPAERDE